MLTCVCMCVKVTHFATSTSLLNHESNPGSLTTPVSLTVWFLFCVEVICVFLLLMCECRKVGMVFVGACVCARVCGGGPLEFSLL